MAKRTVKTKRPAAAPAKRRRNGLFDFFGGKKRKSPTQTAYEKGFAAGKSAAPGAAPAAASGGGGLFSNPKRKPAKRKPAAAGKGKRRRNGLAESLAMGAAAGLASVGAQRLFGPKKNPPGRGRRRNHGGAGDDLTAAAALAADFYGRPAATVEEVYETVHEHAALTKIGPLVALTLQPFEGSNLLEISFESRRTTLAASPSGRQIFILLAEKFPIDELPIADPDQEMIALGWLYSVVYRAKKAHLENETVDYEHVFGDRGDDARGAGGPGDFPVLTYDRLSNRLLVAGGRYHISVPGIVG